MSFLLKCGFGGVQELIAQSRKTMDLAASSAMLSDLAGVAAGAAKAAGASLVLPSDRPGRHWPHQLVVRIAADDEEPVRKTGAAIESAVRGYWRQTILQNHQDLLSGWKANPGSPLGHLAPSLETILNDEAAAVRNQVESALELYWIAVAEEPDYISAYRRLARHYDERRHTRTFAGLDPLRSLERPWTCSLCGVRAAIVQPPRMGWPAGVGFATGREQFCAICVAKRQGFSGGRGVFPSTHRLARSRFSRMAVFASLRSKLSEAQQHRLLDDLDDWLLPDNAAAARGAVGDSWPLTPDVTEALRGLSPYYAILLFDGDRMGRWFSGELGSGDLAENQRLLSDKLFEFATALKTTATDLSSWPVYAGGDDALVFAPLDALLPLVQAGHAHWQSLITDPMEAGRGPTLTVHAHVLHAKEPLQGALLSARQKLEHTKGHGGRNGFSFYADVRAGAPIHCRGSWGDDLEQLIKSVESLSSWRRTDRSQPDAVDANARQLSRLPARLPHTLVKGTRALFAPEYKEQGPPVLQPALQEALRLEVNRLGARSDGGEDSDPLLQWVTDRARDGRAEGWVLPWEAFQEGLRMASFLARELDWGRA